MVVIKYLHLVLQRLRNSLLADALSIFLSKWYWVIVLSGLLVFFLPVLIMVGILYIPEQFWYMKAFCLFVIIIGSGIVGGLRDYHEESP